ncbi:hypothetical protein TrST_g9655 [Triparma strigata]|uniref:PNPLA domain-containing protein n=1 Tax=Triparma strigata TaxID=1606541 RepID=A0A9W7E3L9_9STRA|nr:hypothetical protein TrST_g9655 [Triparma strigata]
MPRQTLCGSSAGSLVSAGVLCGLTVDDTMPIVSRCAKKAREAGVLTSLTPGFSLVDVLDPILREAMKEALERQGVTGNDVDGFIRERVNGDRLRVFVTDPSKFTHPGHFGSHALVNDFSSLEHLLSACILSSYVPVGTGPMIPEPGSTVDKAFKFMEDKWVKRMKKGDGWTVGGDDEDGLEDVSPKKKWWDGGLAVMFPKIDSRTIMVSPVSIRSKTNIVICPRWIGDDSKGVNIGSRGLIANTSWENAVGAKNMLYATEDEEYEKIFNEAYDDARRVCEENSLV